MIKFRRLEYSPGVKEITAGDLRYMFDIQISEKIPDKTIMDPMSSINLIRQAGWECADKSSQNNKIEIIWIQEVRNNSDEEE